MKRGLRLTPKLILLVAFVMLFNFVLVWGFGTLFLERFYLEEKKNVLLNGYRKAQAAWRQNSETAVQAAMEMQNENIRVTIIDKETQEVELSTSNQFNWGVSAQIVTPEVYGFNTIITSYYADTSRFEAILNDEEYNYLSGDLRLNINDRAIVRRLDPDNRQFRLLAKSNGKYYIVETPLQSIQEAADMAIRFSLMVSGLAFVVGIIVAAVLATFMTRPIRQMTHVAQNLSALDFSERVFVNTNGDEVGMLGQSLNMMADALERYTQTVSDTNRQLQKDIEERLSAEQAQRTLVSNISHELKTPLSLISGYAEGLKNGVADEPEARDEYCEVIIEESRRMTGMLHKLLRLARLQSNTQDTVMETVNLSDMADDMLDGLSLSASKKNITLQRDYPSDTAVLAEYDACEQVLRNFLQNALRHTPEGGTIRVSLKRQTNLCLEVYNSGSHVPEKDERIWESFFRGDDARTRDGGEVGLGLSIVKAHMIRHGMPFGVYNTDDGVVFYVHFKNAD